MIVNKHLNAIGVAVLLLTVIPDPAAAQYAVHPETAKDFLKGRPYSPYADRAFPTEVYFGDTHVHTGVDEAVRGRAFAGYDVVFNAAFVGAAARGAVVVPDDGYSRALYAAIAVGYLLVAVGYGAAARGRTRLSGTPGAGTRPSARA